MIGIELFVAVISLISSIAGLIAAIAGKKQVTRCPEQYSALPPEDTISPPGSRAVWYNKTGWLVFSFLCFWPIGLYGLYKSQAVSGIWKRAGFIVIFGGLVVLFSTAQLEEVRNTVSNASSEARAAIEASRQALNENEHLRKEVEELKNKLKRGSFTVGLDGGAR